MTQSLRTVYAVSQVRTKPGRTYGTDGFNIMAPTLPGGLVDFIELVVPELRRRGLFRTEYEGATLRAHLGLRRPPSRFAQQAAAAE